MGLKERIKNIPNSAGVYIFKDKFGRILYIGKANKLRQRLNSYFGRYLSSKTQVLISKVRDISYILTISPSQAQLLEAALIKRYLPTYNVSLRDDKSFPLIRITDEDFPIVSICRKKKKTKKDKSRYFGPYTNVKLLRQALKEIRRIFGFRSCLRLPKSPCLYFRLKLCPGCCGGKISPAGYKEVIKEIEMFLESRYEELLNSLIFKMKQASKEERFEQAAKIRDQIRALSTFSQPQGAFDNISELQGLKTLLKLDRQPLRIEAFDISNIFGKEACGSMVSFYRGLPDKKNYRHFRIKTTEAIDDYKMLKEVIHRRYSRLIRENSGLPDLIIIDGGRSHLRVANEEVRKLGIDLPLISIAKPARQPTGAIRKEDREKIYTKHNVYPLRINSATPALNLILRVRNEAHRFAISYHHVLRRKKIIGK